MSRRPGALLVALTAASIYPTTAMAHTASAEHLRSASRAPQPAATFDITSADASTTARGATFAMRLRGRPGTRRPHRHGELAGAGVNAYVWPTDLPPSTVGFPAQSGILALTATAHPDFDDTPLFDENGDGRRDNDGARWHTHWVVLASQPACGPAGLEVAAMRDNPPAQAPATWPGLPIMIDSPGYTPVFSKRTVRIDIADAAPHGLVGHHFDAVTASLTVGRRAQDPVLCVTRVRDVLSGDLSLPGQITAG